MQFKNRQEELAIKALEAAPGHALTTRALADACGLSGAQTHKLMSELDDEGLIEAVSGLGLSQWRLNPEVLESEFEAETPAPPPVLVPPVPIPMGLPPGSTELPTQPAKSATINPISGKAKKSQYRGVSLSSDGNGRWSTRYRDRNGKQKYGGAFDTEMEAALAYDEHCIREGWPGRCNWPPEGVTPEPVILRFQKPVPVEQLYASGVKATPVKAAIVEAIETQPVLPEPTERTRAAEPIIRVTNRRITVTLEMLAPVEIVESGGGSFSARCPDLRIVGTGNTEANAVDAVIAEISRRTLPQ